MSSLSSRLCHGVCVGEHSSSGAFCFLWLLSFTSTWSFGLYVTADVLKCKRTAGAFEILSAVISIAEIVEVSMFSQRQDLSDG